MNLGLEKHRQQQVRNWFLSEQATIARLELIEGAMNNKPIHPIWRKHLPTHLFGNDEKRVYYKALLDVLTADGYRKNVYTRPGRSKKNLAFGQPSKELFDAYKEQFEDLRETFEKRYIDQRTKEAKEQAEKEIRQLYMM